MPHHTSSGWARGEPVAQTLTASAAPAVPRFGRWLCVLPGWQLNVNVNVRSFCVTRFTVNKKAPVQYWYPVQYSYRLPVKVTGSPRCLFTGTVPGTWLVHPGWVIFLWNGPQQESSKAQ